MVDVREHLKKWALLIGPRATVLSWSEPATSLASVPHSYISQDLHTVTVTMSDGCGSTPTDDIVVVAYDSNDGVITGRGWFIPDARTESASYTNPRRRNVSTIASRWATSRYLPPMLVSLTLVSRPLTDQSLSPQPCHVETTRPCILGSQENADVAVDGLAPTTVRHREGRPCRYEVATDLGDRELHRLDSAVHVD